MMATKQNPAQRNVAIISITARGLGRIPNPCETQQELALAVNAIGQSPSAGEGESLALRVLLRAKPISCNIPIAIADSEYLRFEESQFRKSFNPKKLSPEDPNPPFIYAPIFGFCRRNVMQWGEKLIVHSSRTQFDLDNIPTNEERESKLVRKLHREGKCILQLPVGFTNLINPDGFYMNPRIQARLMGRLNHAYHQMDQKKLLDEFKLFDPLSLSRIGRGEITGAEREPSRRVSIADGCYIDSGVAANGFCVLSASGKPQDISQDEWECFPIIVPSLRMKRNRQTRSAIPLAVGLAVVRNRETLDTTARRRFTIAFEHVFAHVLILLDKKRFVEKWWNPLLSAPGLEERRNAAINFIRAWQRRAVEVESLWALGADDPSVDPVIVARMATALNLRELWVVESRRISDLLIIATEILDEGDMALLS